MFPCPVFAEIEAVRISRGSLISEIRNNFLKASETNHWHSLRQLASVNSTDFQPFLKKKSGPIYTKYT